MSNQAIDTPNYTRPAEGGLRYNSTAASGKWDLTPDDQQEAPEW